MPILSYPLNFDSAPRSEVRKNMEFKYSKERRIPTIQRSLKKLFRRLTNQPYFVKEVGGLKLLLDSNNLVDRHMDTHGVYEPAQLSFLTEQIARHDCKFFIDVGGHWGLYTLWLRKTFGEKVRYIAFEPDHQNRQQFAANLFLNGVEDVDLRDVGLSNQCGEVKFDRVGIKNRGANKISATGTHTIRVTRGDDVLPIREERLAIKLDVEAHEIEAIEGMRDLLTNNQCVLQVESSKDRLAALEKALGNSFKRIGIIEFDCYFSNF